MSDNTWFYTINDGEESAKAYSTKAGAIEACLEEIIAEYGDAALNTPYEVYTKGEYMYVTEDDLR